MIIPNIWEKQKCSKPPTRSWSRFIAEFDTPSTTPTFQTHLTRFTMVYRKFRSHFEQWSLGKRRSSSFINSKINLDILDGTSNIKIIGTLVIVWLFGVQYRPRYTIELDGITCWKSTTSPVKTHRHAATRLLSLLVEVRPWAPFQPGTMAIAPHCWVAFMHIPWCLHDIPMMPSDSNWLLVKSYLLPSGKQTWQKITIFGGWINHKSHMFHSYVSLPKGS